MAKFLLETDKVTEAANSINKLESDATEVSSAISGWDTSNEDGFDFDGAKSIISSNVDAIASKIKNTASALNIVVESHTDLQNTLRLDGEGQTPKKPTDTPESDTADTNDNDPGYTPSGGTPGGYAPSGGNTPKRTGGGGSRSSSPSPSPKPNLAPVVPVAPNVKENQEKEKAEKVEDKKEDIRTEEKQNVDDTPKTIPEEENETGVEKETPTQDEKETPTQDEKTTSVDDVSYAVPKQEQLSNESKEIFNNDVHYDDSGYSKIGDRYVIAADSSLGKVGDVIKFTDSTGKTTECVIGVNTVTSSNKNKMYFLVDEDKTSVNPIKIDTDITSSKAENLGNYKNINATAMTASGVTSTSSDISVEEDTSSDVEETEGDDSNG